MSIQVIDQTFYLHSRNMTMIIENYQGILMLRHLGKPVDRYAGGNRALIIDHSFSPNPTKEGRNFSIDTQRLVLGQFGRGDFRTSSIDIECGNSMITDFRYVDYRIESGNLQMEKLPSPEATDAAETIIFRLEDSLQKLQLELCFTVYNNVTMITSAARLTNYTDDPIVIHKLHSCMLDLPGKDYDILTLQGAYGREKEVVRKPLNQGYYQVASNRGASGHSQTPTILLMDRQTGEDYGEVLALQLMYSGNFQAYAQKSQLGEVRLGIGISDYHFQWKLESGTSFETPVALIQYTDQGLNELSLLSHEFISHYIMPQQFARQERPILINNWEATYFDFNRDKLLALAEQAADLGIELFVLDDGWFGDRSDDMRSLGDWVVNQEKLGGDLSDLISDIKALGLQFGIWIEPEMISEDSHLYRQHPDWVIQIPGRPHTFSRSQLVLDFSNPQVVDYVKGVFDDLLSRYDIDYVKWDMNRNITDIGNGATFQDTMMQSHKHILGVYDFMQFITSRHPHILFESCAGGGGRNDLGVMRYFPQAWASDNTDAISRLAIQYGTSLLYPPISMGAHVSTVPNHQMNRVTLLETRGDVAMMGNLGYELDITRMATRELEVMKGQIARYKQIREIVQLGRQYRLIDPQVNSNEVAVAFVYEDYVLMTYIRILSQIERIETTLKLKGLDEHADYRLEETGVVYSGQELMHAGLTMDLGRGDFLSKQFLFKKI